MFDGHFGAHLLQRGQMQIDGPRTDRAATRQRDERFATAGQKRPEHQHGSAHRLHEFIRSGE